MKNKPRISKWIGRSYLFLTILIAVLYAAIAIRAGVFNHLYVGLFFTVVMISVLVLLCIVTYSFYKTVYTVKGGFLYSWSPFATINLKITDIKKIERTMVPLHFRVGASFYSGRFYISGLGWTKAIITNLADGVLIMDKNRKHYLITPSNPDGFVKSLKSG